jgi:tetratricopeptide (TPR) repeat protein
LALGVEMEFPAPGRVAGVSPVDFDFRQESDRGVVWVGAVDRVSGMEWVCEFVLRSGSAMLEQTVTLRNPTAIRQSYSWWNRAAVEVEAGTKFILPTHLITTPGGLRADTWPVNAGGVDQSVAANDKSSAAFFAAGSHEPFMAVYHGVSRTATVHVADPDVVSGKEAWTGGTDPDAATRKNLSDSDSQHVEIWAGVLPTQDDLRFLEPHQSMRFTEYWIPARQLGGIVRANGVGVLNLERRTADGKSSLVAELNVTHAIPGGRIRIVKGPESVFEETLDLDPATTLSRSLPDPSPEAGYRFELLDRGGATLLAHAEKEYRADAAQAANPGLSPEASNSPAVTELDYLDRGRRDELLRRWRLAENSYRTGLEKFPSSAPLKKAYGLLLAHDARFDEAVRPLSEVAGALPADAESAYYLGIAQAAHGEEEPARKQWERARQDPEWGPAAMLETAASLARSGNPAGALAMLRKTLSANLERRPAMLEAGRVEVPLLRQMGRDAEFRERLQFWLSAAPTDSFLRNERARLEKSGEAIWQHLGADPERVLDVADTYVRLGLYADALAVLEKVYPQSAPNQSEPGAVLPQNSPLVVYYRGYVRGKMGGDGAPDFGEASALPLEYVFPHRATLLPVLRAAVAANSQDGSARWLLGLLYLDSNRLDQATVEWEAARSLRRAIPALDAVLGQTLSALGRKAALPLQHASAPAPRSHVAAAHPAAAAPSIPEGSASPATLSPAEIVDAALKDAAAGALDAAQQFFSARRFPDEKQPEEVRRAYIEIRLRRLLVAASRGDCAAVREGLEKFGDEDRHLPFTLYGFGAFIRTLRFQFHLGEIEAACGQQNTARKRWHKVANAASDPANTDFAFPVLAAAKLGAPDAGDKRAAATDVIAKSMSMATPETRGILLYSQGLLLRAAGQTGRARSAFQDGAKAPDAQMSHYLNLLALQDLK